MPIIGQRCKAMMKSIVFCFCFFAVFVTEHAFGASMLKNECSEYADKALYAGVIDEYSYRMKEIIGKYGCDAIRVYAAFNNEDGTVLDLAEEDDALMHGLLDILRDRDDLVAELAQNDRLTQALGTSLLEESGREAFFSKLKTMPPLSEEGGDPAALALALMIPNLSANYFSQNFSHEELRTLLAMVSLCSLTSAQAAGEACVRGFHEYLPYFSTNPQDSIHIYKSVISAWGNRNIREVIRKSPQCVSVLVPPLSSAELNLDGFISFSPRQFQKMQQEYIILMRDVYGAANRLYNSAWAAEMCQAFADNLALSMINASPQDIANIRKFLLWLVNNESMFRGLFLKSGCYEESNLSLFGQILFFAGFGSGDIHSKTMPLTALASWFAEGNLGHTLDEWTKYTTAQNLSLSLEKVLNGKEDKSAQDGDHLFLANIVQLAMFRYELEESQKQTFDHLSQSLRRSNIHPAVTFGFLNYVKNSLFDVIRPGRFVHPYEVGMHLIAYGYPESGDPSLYEYFMRGDSSPDINEAILTRGRLSEAELLVDGQTFADRHGGVGVEQMIDAVDVVSTVIIFIPGGQVVGPAGKFLTSVAIRIAARNVIKKAFTGAVKTGIRNLGGVGKMARGVKTAGKKPRKPRPKQDTNKVDDLLDRLLDEALLSGPVAASAENPMLDILIEPVALCPQNSTGEN